MHRHLKARYAGPAILAFAMIIAGAVVSVRSTLTNLEDASQVARSHSLLLLLGDVLGSVQDLESGQREFLLAGGHPLLEPWEAAAQRVDRQLVELESHARGDAGLQEEVREIREAARLKMDEVQELVRLYRSSGAEAVASAVRQGKGKALMDSFRQHVASLRQQEMERLEVRQQKMLASFRFTNSAVVLAAAIALGSALTGILLLVLFLVSLQREEHLKSEKNRAQEADRAKTDFLAMMSHEIRTPMNSILGFGELLHDAVEKPQEKHFARAILSSGNSLLSLINDILDLSKIEAAKMEIHPQTVDMRHFLENLETLFSFRAQEKGLDYSLHVDASVPRYLSFDALRLRQVLVNLIGNAVKFTQAGHVAVKARVIPGEGDQATLCVEVGDSGTGIPRQELAAIFRPFYQVQPEKGRHSPGTGLGLSISDRLVSLMGGTIGVESTPGSGSTFQVSLPVGLRDQEPPAENIAGGIHGTDFNRLSAAVILVADEAVLNRELVRGYLAGSHHRILEAENGEQTVILCRRHQPAVVLVDLRLTGVDGQATHSVLKSHPDTKHIPLVAVSATSLVDTPEELKKTFAGFAVKPVSRERLYMELSKFLPVTAIASSPRPQPEPPQTGLPVSDRTWPQLAEILAGLEADPWPQLACLVPAQGTLQFAGHLAILAKKHECPPLEEYARELSEAASTMSFAEAGRLLAAFPDLTDRLRHAAI